MMTFLLLNFIILYREFIYRDIPDDNVLELAVKILTTYERQVNTKEKLNILQNIIAELKNETLYMLTIRRWNNCLLAKEQRRELYFGDLKVMLVQKFTWVLE